MRRATLPLLIVACVVVALALTWFTLNRGSGGAEVTSEVRAVEPFRRLEVNGLADVTLVQGREESVTVETVRGGQPQVRARVDNGTLAISAGDTRRWWSSLLGGSRSNVRPRIKVVFKTLDTIAIAGAVQLSAARIEAAQLWIAASGGSAVRIDDLQAKTLRLTGSGALKATLAGRVVDQEIAISGAGDVRADRLLSDNADVKVSGAGSIVLNAEKTLEATISGAGTVEYYGNPDVRQHVSGVGRVRRRESAHMDGFRVARGASAAGQWSDAAGRASGLNSSGAPVTGSRSA